MSAYCWCAVLKYPLSPVRYQDPVGSGSIEDKVAVGLLRYVLKSAGPRTQSSPCVSGDTDFRVSGFITLAMSVRLAYMKV